jgi:hypothetical protein
MSDAGSNDVVDGLAGRIRKRDRRRSEACHSGRLLLVPQGTSDGSLMIVA